MKRLSLLLALSALSLSFPASAAPTGTVTPQPPDPDKTLTAKCTGAQGPFGGPASLEITVAQVAPNGVPTIVRLVAQQRSGPALTYAARDSSQYLVGLKNGKAGMLVLDAGTTPLPVTFERMGTALLSSAPRNETGNSFSLFAVGGEVFMMQCKIAQ